MAHRKNPTALQRRRKLSNPVFCIYSRKNQTQKCWTNRLKVFQRTKNFGKCKIKKYQNNKSSIRSTPSTYRPGGADRSMISSIQKVGNKENILKLTNAVVYSSHYSKTIYPLFSKDFTFKPYKKKVVTFATRYF